MRIPSVIRLPKHRKFDYQPIYFDPEKEEKKLRLQQLTLEKQENGTFDSNHSYRIGKAFQESRKHKSNEIGIMQALLVVIFMTTALAFWYIGTKSLWIMFLGVAGVYFWTKSKMLAKRKSMLKNKK